MLIVIKSESHQLCSWTRHVQLSNHPRMSRRFQNEEQVTSLPVPFSQILKIGVDDFLGRSGAERTPNAVRTLRTWRRLAHSS